MSERCHGCFNFKDYCTCPSDWDLWEAECVADVEVPDFPQWNGLRGIIDPDFRQPPRPTRNRFHDAIQDIMRDVENERRQRWYDDLGDWR